MADYRNQILKFYNAGLDLNLPPEGLELSSWRKLNNIRILRESVMEGRMHSQDFVTSTYFTPVEYTWTTGTNNYTVSYPDSYEVGRLVWFGYIGKLKDGSPAYLSIHENPKVEAGDYTWPYHSLEYWGSSVWPFSVFVNGIPVIENPWRGLSDISYTPEAPLVLSSYPPSVTRILYPEGASEVIIDGRWRLTPSEIDTASIYPNADFNLTAQPMIYAAVTTNTTTTSWTYVASPAGVLKAIPATGVSPDPRPYMLDKIIAAAYTTGTGLTGDYEYVNTYREKRTGVRSIALGQSVKLASLADDGAQVTQFYAADPSIDKIELWRRGGTIGDSFRLVTTQDNPTSGQWFPTGTTAQWPGVVYTDTNTDAAIALNEALDTSLVRPVTAVDSQGASYSLVAPDHFIRYFYGSATFLTNSNVVSGYYTSGITTGNLWDSTMVGYKLRKRSHDTSYSITTVTAPTTAAGGTLVVNAATTVWSENAGLDFYTIERDPAPLLTFGPFMGQYVFWIGDPVKRTNIYWSNRGKPNLSSADLNYTTISDPAEELMNGIMFGSTPLVFSRRKLYTLDYGGPDSTPSFVTREIPLGLGLSAKWGLAATLDGVYFVNTSGIYVTDGGGGAPSLLSKGLTPLFRGDYVAGTGAIDWNEADEIRLYATNREIHFFYKALAYNSEDGDPLPAGAIFHFVYDLSSLSWSRWIGGYNYAYEMENQGIYRLILGDNQSSDIYYMDDAIRESGTETFQASARTASWDAGIPLSDKEFGVLMLDYDPDGCDISIAQRYNSDTEIGPTTEITYTTAGRQTATIDLGNVLKKSISFAFQWTETSTQHPIFYQAQILFRADEEGITHWANLPSSLGQGGWFHLKDSYWTLRNSAAVTLTVTVDGVEDTYTIPASTLYDNSTQLGRTRHYVEFKARRGKLFSFALDSASPFYFYGEDSQINGKPWKSATKYTPLNVFQNAGYAEYLRKEGGT